MKIILSPAKKMNINTDSLEPMGLPQLIDKTDELWPVSSYGFEDGHFDYVQGHLRILSAFYGVLKAMDGVTPLNDNRRI